MSGRPSASPLASLVSVLRVSGLFVLGAAYSPVSQLSLSPVYGSIPPTLWHSNITVGAFLLAWALMGFRGQAQGYSRYAPLIAFWIPTIQFYLYGFSGTWRAERGALFTEISTYGPLVVLSVLPMAFALDVTPLGSLSIGRGLSGIMSYLAFRWAEMVATRLIHDRIGSNILFTRAGLQFALAGAYALLTPSRALLFAVLPVYHFFSMNVHVPGPATTAELNSTLRRHNFSLIARQESITGYLSVLEDAEKGFRVMRCDHSLLGGEWLPSTGDTAGIVREPVYSVFVMLEAVRLVERDAGGDGELGPSHERERALVMYEHVQKNFPPSFLPATHSTVSNAKTICWGGFSGLGIGTSPSALIYHGIDTTIVELDPAVYSLALEHFSLPRNHTIVLEDALGYVSRTQSEIAGSTNPQALKFDFILHDVFYGGAEPTMLFSQKFIAGLSDLLSEHGVIAIVS
jgi:hypothetical protein